MEFIWTIFILDGVANNNKLSPLGDAQVFGSFFYYFLERNVSKPFLPFVHRSKSTSDIQVDPSVNRKNRYEELQKYREQIKDSEDKWQDVSVISIYHSATAYKPLTAESVMIRATVQSYSPFLGTSHVAQSVFDLQE